jgi:hypothetical protein
MTTVARRLASIPRRTSVDTWEHLVGLTTRPGSRARTELQRITAVASMLIAEEYAHSTPITIAGGGPLVRIYTLHGDEAIDHDLDEEVEFGFDSTGGDSWLMSLPAAGADVGIARSATSDALHVEVRDIGEEGPIRESNQAAAQELLLDLSELERP